MTLGTRVAVMRDGALEQVAPPTEVYRRPANSFVAEFVGNPAMNLLPGASWMMAAPKVPGTPTSGLTVGIRPQDIALVGPGEGDPAGRVELIEPLGGTALAHVRVDGLPGQLVRVLMADDAHVAVGARVGLRPRRDRLHFFNGSSGRRIAATDESDGHGSD